MANLTGLPVNGDLEDGYGPAPDDYATTVRAAIAGGLAGLGIEDTTPIPPHPSIGSTRRWRACAERQRKQKAASC